MNEVSCRAFTFFLEAARAGWISLDELMVGSRLHLKQLSEPSLRVSWTDWSYLCDRFADLVGYHRLQESAMFAMHPSYAGEVISKIAPLITSPFQLYKTGLEWGAASLYRCVTFSVAETSRGIQINVSLQPGYQPSRAWFEMTVGGIRLLPSFVGLPSAVLQATVTSTSASIQVTTAQRNSLLLRGRRLLAAFVAPQHLFHELTFQQQQLLETYHELSRREQSVFDMLAHMPAAIVLFHSGRIVYANASFSEVVGLPISALMDRELSSFVVEAHQELLQQTILEGRADKPTRLLFVESAPRLLLASPLEEVIFEGQRVRGMFATDITEETRAKESLLHHEETLAAMSSTTSDIIARLDREGVVLDIFGGEGVLPAPGAVALRGLSLHLGPSALPAFTAELAARLLASTQKALREQRPQLLELSVSTASLVYECLITPIQAREEVLVIARDITKRRHQERALAVSERMSSLGTLVAGLGHEINNPLTYILGNQQMLLEEIERQLAGEEVDLYEMRELVQEATKGAERVHELVKGLRSFSRVETLPVGSTQLTTAIEESLRLVRNQLHQAQITTELSWSGWVRGAHSQVVQVFVNLLVNALQALEDRQESRVTLRTQHLDDKIIATVEDSGQGISAQDLSRIFDPFFTTKPAGQGTGLGLSIVHRIMEELGGGISVESELGRGTTMTLAFVIAEDPAPEAPEPSAPAPTKRGRVLIIDDEVAVARTMARVLRRYDTVLCDTGSGGLALLRTDRAFDVVICDINMPGCSGIDIYEAVTQDEPAFGARFLFMTGGAFTKRSQDFLEAHHPPIFEKPGSTRELINKVEAIIAGATSS